MPDEHTRVSYLLDDVDHQNADLRAVIAQIRNNAQGTRNDFEKSVPILLPFDPFIKTAANKPKVGFEIYSTEDTRYERGKGTNVDLRWYRREDFAKLRHQLLL